MYFQHIKKGPLQYGEKKNKKIRHCQEADDDQ